MTEEEARKKWCPMARVEEHSVVASNRERLFYQGDNKGWSSPAGLPACRCIASSCMAWRWDSRTTGFCGLAGRPGV
jgi:hypothetical protein